MKTRQNNDCSVGCHCFVPIRGQKKQSFSELLMAPRTGLEPVTSWLTVMRSTDWAIEEYRYVFSFSEQMPIKNRTSIETKLKEMCELASVEFCYAKQQFKPSVY